MRTSDPISVPNLPRSAPQARIDEFLKRLVVRYSVPVRLDDEGDEETGNCVIVVTHGDPAVIDALIREVKSYDGGSTDE